MYFLYFEPEQYIIKTTNVVFNFCIYGITFIKNALIHTKNKITSMQFLINHQIMQK